MTHPTNEVLNTKLTHVLDITKRIEEHVEKTNGHVAKNTKHRLETAPLLADLKTDRDSKYKKYSDLIWKLGVGAGATALGLTSLIK